MKPFSGILILSCILGILAMNETLTAKNDKSKLSSIVISKVGISKKIEIPNEKQNGDLPLVFAPKRYTRSNMSSESVSLIDKHPSTNLSHLNQPGKKRSGKTSFFEDFSQGIPASWLIINVDGLTPHTSVAQFTDAWIALVNYDSVAVNDTVAASTSWYNPPGQSDDWLISPAITLGPNDILQWEAKAQDPSYPDGYEVRISTTTPTVPEFLNNPPLFSTPAEVSTWTYRNVDLANAGYVNQTVYFAIRNNSNDMFILLIDDFEISETPTQPDLAILEVQEVSEYTMLPGFQTRSLNLEASVSNVGGVPLTNIQMNVTVRKDGVVYDNVTSSIVPSLAVGEDTVLLSNYTPPNVSGLFTFEFDATATEPDSNLTNNIDSSWVILTSQTFARDDSIMTGALSIGSGTDGELGQIFTLNSEAMIHSVDFLIQNPSQGMIGQPVYVHLREFASGPGNVIATSDTFIVSDSTAHWITLDFDPPVIVTAESLYVGVVEMDSAALTLGYATNRFTPRAGWAVFPLDPLGTWAPIENYGFQVAFMIRLNSNPSSTDAQLFSSDPVSDYSMVPLNHVTPFNLEANVANQGAIAMNNVQVDVEVHKNGILDFSTFFTTTQIAPGDTVYMGVDTYTPNEYGNYEILMNVSMDEPDQNPLNDSLRILVSITDSIFAHDNDELFGSVGIGTGIWGEMGNKFTLQSSDYVESTTFLLNSNAALVGEPIAVTLREFNTLPDTLLATSDTVAIADSGMYWMTIPFTGGAIQLPAGDFIVSVVEFDPTLPLGYSSEYFKPEVSWVDFPGNPFGGWEPLESYGLPFPFMIRANLSLIASSVLPDISEPLPESFALYQNYPNPFNPTTTIRFDLPVSQKVRLLVYNVLGEKVKTLLNQEMPAGKHVIYTDLNSLASGIYYYRIVAGTYTAKQKMILIK